MLNDLISWVVQSTAFKKVSGILGGLLIGLWVGVAHWPLIKMVREYFGVSRDDLGKHLLGGAGACFVAMSIWASLEKKRRAKRER